MNVAAQNFLTAPVFEVPNPPTEFGQDGGKFFRCYDALAQEIDDDMTSGLKEQLDGMLIFAGLFAGVNTAFLALTIPLLSADPADDTNALLAQNNAILIQLVMGRNDTIPTASPLPSTAFSPPHDILTINALFALSLAFAIISSFLAVLGRQWLVYYRKRGGGGPDRQRWEQLKRFLGAERWRLEAILDDVLPSLLQIGLIIFCISLVLFLRHLSPPIFIIVGIPLSVGLAFFIGGALCTVWDRFCPFHSPLSHLLLWTSHSLSWVGMAMKRNLPFTPTFLEGASLKREEESLESLQAIALQRAICISDDPATILHATANIFAIMNPVAMNQLVDEPSFRQRFEQLLFSSRNGMLQLQGYNVVPNGFAESVGHLYRSVAAHIALTLDSDWVHWSHPFGHLTDVPATAISAPVSLVQKSSSNLIKSSLGIFPLWSSARWSDISERDFENFGNHLTACSQVLAGCSDRQFLTFFSWIVSWFPKRERVSLWSLENIRRAYRGNNVGAAGTVREAFGTLLKAESRNLLDCDTLLTNMLRCVERIVVDEQVNSAVNIGRNLELFESCEVVLRNPRRPDAVGEIGRKLRMNMAQIWSREYTARFTLYYPGDDLIKSLDTYLIHLRNFDRSEFGHLEDVAIVQVFGSMLGQVLSDNDPERTVELAPVCETLNAFVSEVYEASRQIQRNARRARDPDERWCHWLEEPSLIKLAQTRSPIPLLLLSNPAAEQNSIS